MVVRLAHFIYVNTKNETFPISKYVMIYIDLTCITDLSKYAITK